jgi:hypothetical protein
MTGGSKFYVTCHVFLNQDINVEKTAVATVVVVVVVTIFLMKSDGLLKVSWLSR